MEESKYKRCGHCGAWTKRGTLGVYHHRRGDGARCSALIRRRLIPVRIVQPCLFCGLEVETDPGGLCPACLGKREVEMESTS